MYTIVMYCNNIFVANNQNNIFCIIFVNNWRNFLFYAVLRVVFSLLSMMRFDHVQMLKEVSMDVKSFSPEGQLLQEMQASFLLT